MTDVAWRLMIHGGSGAMRPGSLDPAAEAAARAGLDDALAAGAAILSDGGSAVDGAEAAVRSLEENPGFNAGRGSVLTADGCIELDAAIMDGRTRNAGAVAGLRTTRAPLSMARMLMDQGPHVFLSGKGADPPSLKIAAPMPSASSSPARAAASVAGSRLPGRIAPEPP
jgi:beta-aspartyl-peptidase (threonine type)